MILRRADKLKTGDDILVNRQHTIQGIARITKEGEPFGTLRLSLDGRQPITIFPDDYIEIKFD